MKSIVLDIGGTRIKIGIVDNGKIIDSDMTEAFSLSGLLPRLPIIEEIINSLMKKNNLQFSEMCGIGISIPGIVDTKKMRVISVNQKFADTTTFNFLEWAKSKFNLPLILENDARAACAGEYKYGAGTGYSSMVMITLGTGVGGATIIEGNLLHGLHFQAGCLAGHSTINFNGTQCNCGNIGCVETEASSWRIEDMAKNHPLFEKSNLKNEKTIDYEAIFRLSRKGDELATILRTNSLKAWSACVINQIHAYDPEIVVIGGGIMKSHDIIIPFIQNIVNNHAWTPWGKVKVVPAKDFDWAALLGMHYLLTKQ